MIVVPSCKQKALGGGEVAVGEGCATGYTDLRSGGREGGARGKAEKHRVCLDELGRVGTGQQE